MSALDTQPPGVKLPGLRSLRVRVLLRNLVLAALCGGAALVLNLHFLHGPLQQNRDAVVQGQQQHVREALQTRFDDAQNLAVVLNAALLSVWGNPAQMSTLGQTIMAGAWHDTGVIGAVAWRYPARLDVSPDCADDVAACLAQTAPLSGQRASALYWHPGSADDVRVSSVDQPLPAWSALIPAFDQPGCLWTGSHTDAYLDRPVMACIMAIKRDAQHLGLSAVLLDPAALTLPPGKPGEPSYIVLAQDDRVLTSNLVGLDQGASLGQLEAAEPRLERVAEELRQQRQHNLRDAKARLSDWDARLQSLSRSGAPRDASVIEQALLGVVLDQPRHAAVPPAGMGQPVSIYALDGVGRLIALQPAVALVAGLPLSLWLAAAATLGLLGLALLAYHLLTTRLAISPLRRLIRQLGQAAEGDTVNVGGSAEIVVLGQLLNLRQARIRELMGRSQASDPARTTTSASARAGDAGWSLVDALPDGVVVTNAAGEIQYLNRAAEMLCGKNLAQVQSQAFDSVFRVYDRRGKRPLGHLADAISDLAQRDEPPLFALLQDESNTHRPVAISRRVVRNTPDQVHAMVLVIHAQSDAAAPKAGAVAQGERDKLTGCLGRLAFEAELQTRCEAAKADQSTFALLYLDVDRMGAFNDALGRAAGDAFLRQLARLIQSDVGDSNPVYRLHEDKFAVLLSSSDPAEAQVVAELLRADISSWQFEHEGQQHSGSASIGLVHVSGESGRAVDVLRQASTLSQQAQQQGGGRVAASRIQARRQPLRDERSWLAALTQGLAQDRFRLATQKIQPLQRQAENGVAYEAILSFEDDEGSEVAASSFMPIAARHDLVQQVDRWVVARMLHHLAAAPSGLDTLEFCMIPLSVRSMQSPHFLDFLFEHFKTSGIAPAKICFDLNENDVQGQLNNVRSFCHTMSQVGCRLSLSGVSTRPASYELIKQLPVQLVRFDPLLTRQIDTDEVERLATESLHRIVYTLGKQSMVTQVANRALLELVQKIGVHYAQGDAIARISTTPFDDAQA